jgi:hypothetical protein
MYTLSAVSILVMDTAVRCIKAFISLLRFGQYSHLGAVVQLQPHMVHRTFNKKFKLKLL